MSLVIVDLADPEPGQSQGSAAAGKPPVGKRSLLWHYLTALIPCNIFPGVPPLTLRSTDGHRPIAYNVSMDEQILPAVGPDKWRVLWANPPTHRF
jgi:hypothetical protein